MLVSLVSHDWKIEVGSEDKKEAIPFIVGLKTLTTPSLCPDMVKFYLKIWFQYKYPVICKKDCRLSING